MAAKTSKPKNSKTVHLTKRDSQPEAGVLIKKGIGIAVAAFAAAITVMYFGEDMMQSLTDITAWAIGLFASKG